MDWVDLRLVVRSVLQELKPVGADPNKMCEGFHLIASLSTAFIFGVYWLAVSAFW
jgi:hypothetical protein